MIKEQYVSLETAKLLKEKGFDEEVYRAYEIKSDPHGFLMGWQGSVGNRENIYPAPSQSVTMRWLREVHNLHIEIYVIRNLDKKILEYRITVMPLEIPATDDGIELLSTYIFKTYEEACEAAIKYCLENLI